MNICILVATYKRNGSLIRLLKQLNERLKNYSGANNYKFCVTDSDRDNPEQAKIESLVNLYVTNAGEGFDDNLYYFYQNHLEGYDYVLSFSDDDVFALSELNPFLMIDASLESGKRAILFNHISYFSSKDGLMLLTGRHYQDDALSYDGEALRRHVLGHIPRHIGIIYSTELIREFLPISEPFRGTLHLYAAPYVLEAAKADCVFVDYPLLYFKAGPQKDGAWIDLTKVFDGLVKFLAALRQTLSEQAFQIALEGFMTNYFGDEAEFRRNLVKKGCDQLMSAQDIVRFVMLK